MSFREDNMRLDKFLKVSRVIKRRTVANNACDAGRVTVNGKVARASYDIKINDIVEVTFGEKTLKFQVLNVSEVIRKDDASSMYKIIQ